MIYDISPPIKQSIAVWPGDVPYKRVVDLDMAKGSHMTLSHIQTTLHVGSHADAPSHYAKYGKTIDEISLDYYIGPCQVIHIKPLYVPFTITPDDLKNIKIQAPRVLFRTETFTDVNQWSEHFAHLCPETIQLLHDHRVKLVGIDTPSVDAFESKTLKTHTTISEYEMVILEGLVLSNVPENIYELIALPLKLVGADASPVRAILREKIEWN